MTRDEPLTGPPLSNTARYVFNYIRRHGGTMRTGPLLRGAGLERRALVDAIAELQERCWVTLTWRKPIPDPEVGGRFEDVERVTTTRFGRWRYTVTWPAY